MVGDHTTGVLLRSAVLCLAALLGGCGQMSGLSSLSLLGGGTQDSAEANPEAQVQLAALSPSETPPLPTRRPGKRLALRQAAQPNAPATPPSQSAPAAAQAKPEGSGLSLAALGDSLFAGSADAGGPNAVLIEQKPIDAYSLLAQRIKYCWLNPSSPRLPNHGFYSDLPAGEVREAKMVVYEKSPDGRRGSTVFKVDITAESSGALISAQNVKLDKTLDANFKADLARWAKGDERC